MHWHRWTITLGALSLIALAVPVTTALAQHDRQQHGGEDRGGADRGGADRGGDDRGGGDRGRRDWGGHRHGGGGRGDQGFRGGGAGGFAFGAMLGYYGGRPYYCRNHRHWRWSHRLQRYVYSTRSAYC